MYDHARPEYPPQLFEDLMGLAGLPPDPLVLEIGCASGKATRPLATKGVRIVALEKGPNLAREAEANLSAFPNVKVVNASFEEWDSPDTFDLIYAATAWHWLDPEVRYKKAARLLDSGGALAFWSATHAFPQGFDPFFTEIQQVYDQLGESYGEPWPPPPPESIPDSADEIRATGLFDHVKVRRYVWELDYTAEEYIRLLETFSGHIAMPEARRNTLYAVIREHIAARPEGRVKRHWMSILHVARRTEGL